jgi:tetratricopeptide (TPR) repeat protein
MSSPDELIRRARALLNDEKPREALEPAREAVRLAPDSGDAHLTLAVALSRSEEDSSEAEAEFRSAIERMPEQPKAYYNFGVHAFDRRQFDLAEEMARAALARDPQYREARALLRRIDGMRHIQGPREVLPGGLRQGYADGGMIDFVREAEPRWTHMGWILIAIGLFATVFFYMVGAAEPAGGGPFGGVRFGEGGVAFAAIALNIAARIAILLWFILDALNRRRGYIWFAPVFLLCCFGGLHFLPLALYMVTSRRI